MIYGRKIVSDWIGYRYYFEKVTDKWDGVPIEGKTVLLSEVIIVFFVCYAAGNDLLMCQKQT